MPITPPDPARPDHRPPPDDPRDRPADPTAPTPAPARPVTADPVPAVALRPQATVRATVPSRAELANGPTVLRIVPWEDPLLDRFGHDPRSPYVERFWLGVLGPSATWLLRSFAHGFDLHADGFDVDLRETARALGIGSRSGANGALFRTMERVMAFGFAQFTDDTTLAVRRRMGPLNRRQQQRLPEHLQREHDDWLVAHPPTTEPSPTDVRRRARALALSLVELGEDVEATEAQLHRWRFHPALAYDAARWAVEVHRHRLGQQGSRSASELPDGGDAEGRDLPPGVGVLRRPRDAGGDAA